MDSETKISRRKMLKNVGIAGAVAWTAPIITSLSAPAFASVDSRDRKSCFALSKLGGDCAQCSGTSLNCQGDSTCACHVDAAGCCSCSANATCAGLTACTRNSQCLANQKCVISCCSTTQAFCVPVCGSVARVSAKRGERMTNFT